MVMTLERPQDGEAVEEKGCLPFRTLTNHPFCIMSLVTSSQQLLTLYF